MSKYNLTDILEQYRIGSGWTTDFDYDGMLKTGLGTSIDTPIKVLKKMSDDFEDVNYHRENSHLQDAIDAIEIGDMMEAEGRLSDFHAEIRKTMEEFGMDIEPTVGQFMDAKMDMMNEDEFDEVRQAAIESSQEAAGIKEDKDKEPRDGVKSAAAKLGMKPKHVKEVSSREGSRIEGLLSIPLKSKFLEAFQDLYFDLVEEDPFMAEDVVDHLGIEMLKHLDAIQAQGDKLAGMDQQEFTAIDEKDTFNFDMKADADYDEGLEDIEEALPKFKGVPPMRDIVKALKNDAKATDSEIKQFMASVKKAGDEFDDVDDYVEDFKNYVADKALQEAQYAPEVVDRIEMVRKALFDTSKFSQMEIESYVKSLLRDFDKGDFEAYDDYEADDYVKDMNNYIADKALQEHFKRFM
jgi:BMFP domain-containing protein YqiC